MLLYIDDLLACNRRMQNYTSFKFKYYVSIRLYPKNTPNLLISYHMLEWLARVQIMMLRELLIFYLQIISSKQVLSKLEITFRTNVFNSN